MNKQSFLNVICLMSAVFTINSCFAGNNESPKVVVVGAGLAGLTTAYRLQNAGMDVDLYEARNRVGGRVFTVSINGAPAELGAQNIADGGKSVNINRLINELHLEVTKSRVNLNHSYFDGKNLISVNKLLLEKKFDPNSLRTQLYQLASSCCNMQEILHSVIGQDDPLYKILAVRLAAYEGDLIEKLSPFYIETLFHMLLGGICSAHQGNSNEENYVDFISLKKGNATLPQKLGEKLGARLHLNKVLTHVSKNREDVFTLTFHDGQKEKADILILAIPCSVYKQIRFEENVIPFNRLQDIQNIQYGTNAKILIPCFSMPTKSTGLINDQTVCFFDSEQSILTAYYTGESSRFSHETILKPYSLVKPMIEIGFADASPSFNTPTYAGNHAFAEYNTSVGYSWPNDPYAGGSYSYISPGQESLLTATTQEKDENFRKLFAPIDNLYFAGEHASILMDIPGTMETACESGERIARAILKNQKI